MNKIKFIGSANPPRCAQRGISLIMVLLIMMLVGLTAVSASKSALFNESITGNEADYNRALAAAEAMVREAQLDILGAPNCLPATCRVTDGGQPPTVAAPFFPDSLTSLVELQAVLATQLNSCAQGVCAPLDYTVNGLPANFWLNSATLAANTPNAAWYGRFTGANPATTGNPILTANPRRAWYWIEAIEFDVNGCALAGRNVNCIQRPQQGSPFIYRISAVAQGNRPGTVAGIQTFFVPYPTTTP